MEEEQKQEAPEELEEAVTPEEQEEALEEGVKEGEKTAEDMIRDLINFINVKKEEEVEGATHRIEADTAAQLVEKLEELAKKVAEIGK